MTQNELLQLADAHFSCLEVDRLDTDGKLRLFSEMGLDVTCELEEFIQAFLLAHEKSPYVASK